MDHTKGNILKLQIFLISLLFAQTITPESTLGTSVATPIGYLSASTPVSDKLIIGLILTAISAGIINNLLWHSTYSYKAMTYFQTLTNYIQNNDIDDLSDQQLEQLFDISDFDSLIQHHFWLNNSYNNWLLFWNWSASQKIALEQFYVTLIITMYSNLIQLKDNLTADNLKKNFRQKFSIISIYPLITAFEQLEQQYNFITKNSYKFNSNIQCLLNQALPFLKAFSVMLRADPEYIRELSDKRTHDLQQAQINATFASRR